MEKKFSEFFHYEKDNGNRPWKCQNYITHYYVERKLPTFLEKGGLFSFIGWTPRQETHDEIWLASALPAVTRIKIGYIIGTIEGGGCSPN